MAEAADKMTGAQGGDDARGRRGGLPVTMVRDLSKAWGGARGIVEADKV